MAGSHPYTKTLTKATPKVRKADGVVLEWEIEVLLVSTENGWKKKEREREEVGYMGKTVDQFTKTELLEMVNVNDHVFDAHWEAHNTPAKDERIDDFDINSLPE